MMETHWSPSLEVRHSPDRHWWWNGSAWLPAHSADGRYWWNGYTWVPVSGTQRRLRDLPGWLVWRWSAWLPFLVAWVPAVTVVWSHHDSSRLITTIAATFGGLAVIATVAVGSSLG